MNLRSGIIVVSFVLIAGLDARGQTLLQSLVGPTGPSGINGFGSRVLGIDDRNGDGVDDLAVTDLLYESAGGFSWFASSNNTPVNVSDFALAFAGPAAGRVWLVSGADGSQLGFCTFPAASGTTDPLWFLRCGFGSHLTTLGDQDGDGKREIVVGNRVRGYSVYQGNTTTPTYAFAGASGYERVEPVGDWDGDGLEDLGRRYAVSNPNSTISQHLVVRRAAGTPLADLAPTVVNVGAYYRYEYFADIGDVTGTPTHEFLIGDYAGLGEVALVSQINGPLSTPSILRTHLGPWQSFATVGDCDLDGVADYAIFWMDYFGTGPYSITVYSTVSGLPISTASLPRADFAVAAPYWATPVDCLKATGDVDRDGIPDYALGCITSALGVRIFSGRDGSVISTIIPPNVPAAANSASAYYGSFSRVGDQNGDGIDEIAIGVQPFVHIYSPAPAGVAYFGQGCPPAVGGETPVFGTGGQLAGGGTFAFHLSKAQVGGLGVLMLGFSNAYWQNFVLPLDLGLVGVPGLTGCDLLVAPDLLDFAYVATDGWAHYVYNFPNVTLTGVQLYAQWLVENPFGTLPPYQLSNAASLIFQ